jgi:hypothetical protein
MKKTLIAMAVLAASGASFAQVSITGAVAMGYQADTNASNVATGGLGIDTTALTFAASEDLGGGLKASASLGLDGVNRGGANGGDTAMSLSGSFGKVGFSSSRGSDYLSGGVAGVAGIGLDGKLFSGLVATDNMTYALPAFGPVTVSFVTEEVTTAENAAGGFGIGSGGGFAAGATPAAYQRRNGVAVAYSAGPLAANAAYQAYDRNTSAEGSTQMSNRVRASFSYDLGVAKLGAGFDQRQLVVGTRVDSLLGVSVPVGAWTLGAQYGLRTTADYVSAASNGTRSSTGLKAAYALSARTSLSYTYVKFDASVNPANASTYQAVLLAHSF